METKKNFKKNPQNNRFKKTKKKKKKPQKKLHWIVEQSKIAMRRKPRNFDFTVDWPRVEVTDKTLSRIANVMNLDEDDAFDRAFDILEEHEQFRIDARWIYREYLKRRFRGEWIHIQWHTYENIQIGIENNRWTRLNFNTDSLYLSEEVKQEVYNAEDGRCEACGQAMHFRVAQFVKRDWTIFNDTENIKLLCYPCKAGRRNVLFSPHLVILDRNIDYLRVKMKMEDNDEVKQFIKENLKYAVHTNTFNPNKQQNRKQVKDLKLRGQYWLPGIGRFRLQVHYIDKRKGYAIQFVECAKNPSLNIQPQKHTRGLK
ncbi:hypothetical protein BK126_26520 [Paenibacillus sp. FSL H7-0326]|uniref:hypothetical protein n=1 Tax=Paenibacillus sp. FSL H7-0326 TaxID=1921144 RepID=UPI00096FDBAE|nr:hypothetical protein [Paenibacillus sp. FSL H7-0326]OMC63750.1 hypothetical protein BK126_26520 [Paenibacillus sp. FSL H7-0326]